MEVGVAIVCVRPGLAPAGEPALLSPLLVLLLLLARLVCHAVADAVVVSFWEWVMGGSVVSAAADGDIESNGAGRESCSLMGERDGWMDR